MSYHDHRDRNQEEHDCHYHRYISNIAYRFKFKVIEEDGGVYKVCDGKKSLLFCEGEVHPHKLWSNVWVKLKEEYGFSGMSHDMYDRKV